MTYELENYVTKKKLEGKLSSYYIRGEYLFLTKESITLKFLIELLNDKDNGLLWLDNRIEQLNRIVNKEENPPIVTSTIPMFFEKQIEDARFLKSECWKEKQEIEDIVKRESDKLRNELMNKKHNGISYYDKLVQSQQILLSLNDIEVRE